jgi:hypothetical protein
MQEEGDSFALIQEGTKKHAKTQDRMKLFLF